jgi:hypothetical protein
MIVRRHASDLCSPSSTSVEVVRTHASTQGARCCCAYSYFDARGSGGALRKFETLLRSILDQLCFNAADVPDAMKRLYGVDSNAHPEPTLAQLRTTLEEVVKGFDNVYILIDALDECDSQEELLDWMNSLQSTAQGLHLLATSRPERIIEERMSSPSHVRISLSSQLLDDDIKTYVDQRVDSQRRPEVIDDGGDEKEAESTGRWNVSTVSNAEDVSSSNGRLGFGWSPSG